MLVADVSLRMPRMMNVIEEHFWYTIYEVNHMKTNQDIMQSVLCYIEEHLDASLTLDAIAAYTGYSPYHLHKMFTAICGMPLHAYVRRRQVSKGALLLVHSDLSIAEIAFACGYLSQQAFHKAFLQLYRTTPDAFRKKKTAYVLQEPLQLHQEPNINHMHMDMEIQHWGEIQLEGYHADTRQGFHVIGKCHRKCNRYRKAYPQKTPVVYGIHDYTDADLDAEQPCFQYFAGVAVEQVRKQKLKHIILPEGTYLVFSFFADPKTSMEPFAQDIYQNWLPKSAYRLRADCCMDIVKYGEETAQGVADIEYCIPILK